MSAIYDVRAVPWASGWELHVDGLGVTQVRVLTRLREQVRDFVETISGDVPADEQIRVRYDLGGVETEVARAQTATEAAVRMQAEAAESARSAVARLRAAGLSVRDIATILGRSPGRVSQLLAD